MTKTAKARPEFCRLLAFEAIAESEKLHRIEATAEERRALARRLGLAEISRLSAELRVWRPAGGEVIHLRGHLTGALTQTCIVSLAELPVRVHENLAQDYSQSQDADAPEEIDVGREDPPEAVGPDGLDLGEAVVQYLAGCLDPYPRAADARLERSAWGEDAEEKDSPFAVLKALKDDT